MLRKWLFALLLAPFALCAQAAVTAGDSGSTSGATSVATAGTLNVSIGDVVLVVVAAGSGPQTVTSIGDNASTSNTYTADASNPQLIGGGSINEYIYTSVITTAKTGLVITANYSGATPGSISAARVTGRSGTPILVRVPFIESTRTTSHTTAATGAIAAGCDVVAMVADTAFYDWGVGTETYTPGAPFSLLSGATVNTASTTLTSYIVYQNNVGSGSSQTATWTSSGGTITAGSVIFALSPAAGANPARSLLTLGVGM